MGDKLAICMLQVMQLLQTLQVLLQIRPFQIVGARVVGIDSNIFVQDYCKG